MGTYIGLLRIQILKGKPFCHATQLQTPSNPRHYLLRLRVQMTFSLPLQADLRLFNHIFYLLFQTFVTAVIMFIIRLPFPILLVFLILFLLRTIELPCLLILLLPPIPARIHSPVAQRLPDMNHSLHHPVLPPQRPLPFVTITSQPPYHDVDLGNVTGLQTRAGYSHR